MNIKIEAQLERVAISKEKVNNLNPMENRAIFPIRVIEVNGEKVIVSANGNCLEVTSQVSLSPGQVFFVRRVQTAGETEKWQILHEVRETNPQSILARLGISENLENKVIINALSKAGLPIAEDIIHLIRLLIEKSGGLTYENLIAAMAFLKYGISVELLLPLLIPFIEKIAIAQDCLKRRERKAENEERSSRFDDEVNGSEFLGYRLRESFHTLEGMLRCLAAGLKTASIEELKKLSNELGDMEKVLLGGQLFAWIQENLRENEAFYYIPLFVPYRTEELPLGEILIYPKSTKKTARIRLVLNLATCYLGWIQTELSLDEESLKVGMRVEKQTTKQLIDRNWPELADTLKECGYNFVWSGCKVGIIRSFFRALLEGYFSPEIHNALDLKI